MTVTITKRYGKIIEKGMIIKFPSENHIVASIRCNQPIKFEIIKIIDEWGYRYLIIKSLSTHLKKDDFTYHKKESPGVTGGWKTSNALVNDIIYGNSIRISVNAITREMIKSNKIQKKPTEVVNELTDFLL